MHKTSISLILLFAACKNNLNLQTIDPTTTPEEVTEEEETTEEEVVLDFAADLAISKISLYQGVEIVLWEDGSEPGRVQAPIVTNRDALVRVFLRAKSGFEARRIAGHLFFEGGDSDGVELVSKMRVEGPPSDKALDSTLNFEIGPDMIRKATELKLEIREANEDGPGGGDPRDLRWKSERDMDGGLGAVGTDDLTIAIIPIRYNADGSGRLPDTSASDIQRIHDLVYANYPAQSVTIRVDDPIPWNSNITASGGGWSQLLAEIADRRERANELPNTYYYGLFSPSSNFYSFCSFGCVAGLSNLGSANQVWSRSSIGLGYSQNNLAAETLVHEVGHAHGRYHAPCGGASGTDPAFPYPGAKIGTWGYDLIEKDLLDPNVYTDIMGYCNRIWVSDYTYDALWERIDQLSTQARVIPRTVTRLLTDGADDTQVYGTLQLYGDDGEPVEVTLFDASGAEAGVARGQLFPNSHLPGGVIGLDRVLPEGWTAELR
ncbi:MAG TPA: hypothetical protein ENK18_10700 [Deltaproteobacteria bacterium]|nr:hypothetical protein [Deltaproteobacteria bacterium]